MRRRRTGAPAAGEQVLRQGARAGRHRPDAARRRAARAARPQRRGQDHRDRPAARACCAPTAGTVELFGQRSAATSPRAAHIGVMLQDAAAAGDAARRRTAFAWPPVTTRRRAACRKARTWPASPTCCSAATASCPAASSDACSSRSPSAAGRSCCSSTNRPSAWTSKRARTCGRAIRHLVAEGNGVVLTTHYLEEAEALADRVCVMAQRPRHQRRQRRCVARARCDEARALRDATARRGGRRLAAACVEVDARRRPPVHRDRARRSRRAPPARARRRPAGAGSARRGPGRGLHRTHPRRRRRTSQEAA